MAFAKSKSSNAPCECRYLIDSKKEQFFMSGPDRLVNFPAETVVPVVKERHDVHRMVTAEFSNVWVALFYILFVVLVGLHLNHAIQSAVHTLGLEGPKFTPIMQLASIGLSIILVLLFCVVPVGVIAINLLNFFGIDIVGIIGGLI